MSANPRVSFSRAFAENNFVCANVRGCPWLSVNPGEISREKKSPKRNRRKGSIVLVAGRKEILISSVVLDFPLDFGFAFLESDDKGTFLATGPDINVAG